MQKFMCEYACGVHDGNSMSGEEPFGSLPVTCSATASGTASTPPRECLLLTQSGHHYSKRTLSGCSLLLPRHTTEGDDGPHDFCSRGGCWSFGLQPACDGRRSSLVRRDKLWRVLGLPVSLA